MTRSLEEHFEHFEGMIVEATTPKCGRHRWRRCWSSSMCEAKDPAFVGSAYEGYLG